MRTLYIYIDESGDLTFSNKGTKYYVITSVITLNPIPAITKLEELKYEYLANWRAIGLKEDYIVNQLANGFHATYDNRQVRNKVFTIIDSMSHKIAINAIVVEKRKANPRICNAHNFYPRMSTPLLRYIKQRYRSRFDNLCIIFSATPTEQNKGLFKQALKSEIKSIGISQPYEIYFPESKSDRFLGIADYCSWAIFKKWEDNDLSAYEVIKSQLSAPELEIFRNSDGTIYY